MVAFNVRKYIVKSCGKASLFLLSILDLVVAKHSKSNIVLRPKVHPYVANTSNCHELKFVLYLPFSKLYLKNRYHDIMISWYHLYGLFLDDYRFF